MRDFTRYAIYYTFPPGPLAEFGAAWLGWDAARGQEVTPPEIGPLPRPVTELTATPRKYGLHGTIKPPFQLAEGARAADLQAAFRAFCDTRAPVMLDGLRLARMGSFLALMPEGETGPLSDLAAAVVAGLDAFRSPLTPDALARRRQARLTERQEALLLRWGYPHVMEAFRFHVTLTGRLSRAEAEQTRTTLEPVLAPLLPRPFAVEALTLCGEDGTGRFHEIDRRSLAG
ncbi:DUF1045 domain-containing protein [Pseudoponticoccus marisrubri]|uniref:Phosphonate metabolism protein n=1 Tax=Pseudoponticoccus marisrubri TaxID=1685382 RepID=A0A0W7WIN9_9RHOB|nr:DUF1045 domain-containing protein [Pseudoponticoccus marisrubri]KUF10496.1 phosphonate metabolism protein [Pseudoponticoccus marisrubri]